MILTCPECATGYFVEDSQIRAGGRKVRCAACGARWMARPDGALDLVTSEEGAIARDPTADAAAGPAPITAEELPRVFRDRAQEERRLRQAATAGVAWAAGAVVVIALIGIAVVFREGVVRAWPPTASFYAAIGLPVNPTGLVVEQVHFEPALHQGYATLDVSGVIRNVVDRPVIAPPLRITLFNTQGKRVAGQIAMLDNARIPPGESRHFMTSILNPPLSAASLWVDFVLDARPGAPSQTVRGPAAPVPTPPSFTLRGASADAPAANVSAPPGPQSAPASAPAVNAATNGPPAIR
jgi:predicted Zn finger-like uncharacterized protein